MTSMVLDILKDKKGRVLYFLMLMVLGFWISPLWPVFLLIWLGISLFWCYTKQIELLSVLEVKVYHWALYLYPVLGTLIKFYIYLDWFPNSYFWVNRLEHAIWSMALVILLIPFWRGFKSNLNQFVIILGLVCVFGNMVEFVEFGFRVLAHLQYKYASYYPDTIFDMMSNVVGAMFGCGIVKKSTTHSS